MKYLWLLFDADDTLFDYPRAEAAALQRTLEESGVRFQGKILAIYQKFNRQVWGEFERGEIDALELRTKRFRLLFEEAGIPCDPDPFSPRYLQNLAGCSQLFEGVPEVLDSLSAHHHLALVTNGLKDVQRPRLAGSAIAPFIDKIFISEEIGAAKPEPAFFEAVFRGIGLPAKKEVLIIGDSLTSDMQGGIGYGIDTCWYNPEGNSTDLAITYQVRHLHQLLDLLGD
jgi:2-haloacid dehalogenase